MEIKNDILDIDSVGNANPPQDFKVMSVGKFIFLTFISLGLYQTWWSYKSWRFFKQRENSDIMPAARAIFSIFYLIPLFNRILDLAQQRGYSENYNSTSLFIGFFICNVLSRLPDPYWLISTAAIFFVVPPFKALNFALQNDPDVNAIEDDGFSGRQILLVILGIVFWALIILVLSRKNY